MTGLHFRGAAANASHAPAATIPRQRATRILLAGSLLCVGGVAQALPGATTVAGGSLMVNGTLGNTAVSVSNSGILGGNGIVGGAVLLASSGIVAPGALNAVGELDGDALTWQGGGSIAFQLGANDALSDHLAFAGSLVRQNAGTFQFQFADGAAPPTAGTTYTLITFANQSGFTPADFSYVYTGSADALIGQFQLNANALLFTVISTPVELQSFDVQ